MEEQVTLSLVDFHVRDEDPEENNQEITKGSSIRTYDWLHNKLGQQLSYNFMKTESVHVKKVLRIPSYDVKVSYRYNCFILYNYDQVIIIDRKTKEILKVMDISVNMLCLDDDLDEIYYIYYNQYIIKMKLGDFVAMTSGENRCLWQAEFFVNAYAIDILKRGSNRYVLILDRHREGLIMFDCETGSMISFESVNEDIINSLCLKVVGEDQLFVIGTDIIQRYEIDQHSWKVSLKQSKPLQKMDTCFSMTFDLERDYMLYSDLTNIVVLEKDSLKEVKKFNYEKRGLSGVYFENRTRELFVCLVSELEVLK